MGMNNRNTLTASIALILWLVATSCSHKQIECPALSTGINIRFEWENASNADVDGMTLFFYPVDGHSRIWRFDIAGRDGGRVEIPVGSYMMIACNNDLPGAAIEGTQSASVIHSSPTRRLENGVYASTGMLYGGVVSRIDVTVCGVRYITPDGMVKNCGKGLVRCLPDSLSTHYTVAFRHVKGLESVRSVSVMIGPVASELFLGSGLSGGVDSRLYLPMTLDVRQNELVGSGCAFGTADRATSAQSLWVRIEKTDGKIVSGKIEISPENLNIRSPHNVFISIDGLVIPSGGQSPGDVGGIDAEVDGWSVVEIDLDSTISTQ